MEAILSFFRELKESNNELFSKVTSDGEPDSQKLRMYLNENSIDCKGSNMFSLVRAFSESLKTNTNTNTTNPEKKEKKEKQEQEQKELHEQKEELEKEEHEKNEQKEQKEELKKRFSKLNFDPVSVQSLSFASP
jgi:hypothetical protein